MSRVIEPWNYLIVTASNESQAAAYESQLRLRRDLGLLVGAEEVLVLPDPGGRRIGSGGSTLFCLMEVLARRLGGAALDDPEAWRETLAPLRVLIVHAGGDSRRLPAYGPCGKIFVPLPGNSDSAVGMTLFDRQIGTYLDLPAPPDGRGQIVIASGDVLLDFDPTAVRFDAPGMVGLGCRAAPDDAARHGVYVADSDGTVRRFLQKPTPARQRAVGAVDRYNRSVLDIGVIGFDADAAVSLLTAFGIGRNDDGALHWSAELGEAVHERELDFYREICCAMGSEASAADRAEATIAAGSSWTPPLLGRLFQALKDTEFTVQVLPDCRFLHFGTTRQLLTSGHPLAQADHGPDDRRSVLTINTQVGDSGRISGEKAWVEGCRVSAPLALNGENVVVGVDVHLQLDLPRGACLDVIGGTAGNGSAAWFVRCYGIDDSFKTPADDGATLCRRPVHTWLAAAGLAPEDVWDADIPEDKRTVWDARVFPAVAEPTGWREWLWLLAPETASDEQKRAYRDGQRYSPAQIALAADAEAFQQRRARIRAGALRGSLRQSFRPDSDFSAADLAYLLSAMQADDRGPWVAQLLAEASWHHNRQDAAGRHEASFDVSRIIHTLGTAVDAIAPGDDTLGTVLPHLDDALDDAQRTWLGELGLPDAFDIPAAEWAARARVAAFGEMGRAILTSEPRCNKPPRSALRSDEIVWGRAPARLDLGGGWSDTPPYTLERGGCVLNAAVDLNGQPPIHCYARVVNEPVIRLASIDLGKRIEITTTDELMDFRSPDAEFALAKAALALSGLSHAAADWPTDISLQAMLERFGGGIELTTLSGIPKGSGLGTSSIVAAVVLSVVARLMGRELTRDALFRGVLRLEQALTTGGGWQDQVGGAVDGVKVISTSPGLRPEARIHYVPDDVLDPAVNGGTTLLYYTGITRLAKNILQQVVGRYLDRDRIALATLADIHALPTRVADAMARKDPAAFGACIDTGWRLNKRLDPNSTNDAVEALLARVEPHVYGAKLLGAGGGGFLLMICKSPNDAADVRDMLTAEPPNNRARFFDFSISRQGLVVTVC
ncbi:MAG: hypothetical protein KGY99_11020 [Phycisphaerae bacterium]|nr:hypothetical protein [Phycisphaerae bacterium]